MKYLKITNKNEVEVEAFNLLGASTKVGDEGKIGMFGSGNKYAIAYFMRNNIPFKIFSGEKEILFSTKEVIMREQSFQRILINGEPTSMTTSTGKDWECWMAIREIYCNAVDEGGHLKTIEEEIKPEAGNTSIFIGMTTEVEEIVNNWNDYFSENRNAIHNSGEYKLFNSQKGLRIYRRGILCSYEKDIKTVFDYDFSTISINESRQVSSSFEANWCIRRELMGCNDEKVILRLIKQIKGKLESRLDWSTYGGYDNAWAEAIGDTPIVEIDQEGRYISDSEIGTKKYYALPTSLVEGLLSQFSSISHVAGDNGRKGIKVIKITPLQDNMIQRAFDFFTECEYEITSPINICEFTCNKTIGQALDGEIYLCDKAFEGMYQLIITLIEEQEHINTGFNDETRDFQSHFMKLFLNEKIKRFSYIL